MKTKTVWVPVYKCERCGVEITTVEPRYNDYGMSQFPDVDAPLVIAHKCKSGVVGRARLVGLNKLANVKHEGQA